MKISSVETVCLSRLHSPAESWFTFDIRAIKSDAVVVIVKTDEGLQGIGEASPYGNPVLIQGMVARLARHLVGSDTADALPALHPNGRRDRPSGTGSPSQAYDCAVAGIEVALWDIRGQAEGKRVAQLLTAKPLERVRLYASGGVRYDWRHRPESLIEEVLGYIDQGFTACKVRPGTKWRYDGVTVERFLGLMTDLTQAVAGRLELMLDGNQLMTEDQALPVAKGLDRLGWTWFEEPLPTADIDGYARLNAAVDLPITGGEQLTTLEQFLPYFEAGAYSIAQPDVAETGLAEAFRIATVAADFGIDVCPHSWHNGLMAVTHAHYVAALPNPRVVELCMVQGPLQWGILADPPKINDGWMELPTDPGLGVRLADGLEARFPYIEGEYHVLVTR